MRYPVLGATLVLAFYTLGVVTRFVFFGPEAIIQFTEGFIAGGVTVWLAYSGRIFDWLLGLAIGR